MQHNQINSPSAGTNDDAQDVPPERFADSMQSFIERLRDTYRASLKHICVLVSHSRTQFAPFNVVDHAPAAPLP